MKLTSLRLAVSPSSNTAAQRVMALMITAAAVLVGAAMADSALAQTNPAVMPVSGELSKQSVSRMLLTDAARSGTRIVAVGDRGYVVFSDSDGERWERAKTPANLPMLTAVYFADANTVWAVGHDAIILKSTDQGKNWEKAFSAEKEKRPLMDILFLDANIGFAVGAYGAFFETSDGGKTWAQRKVVPPAPKVAAPPKSSRGGKAALDAEDEKGSDEDRHLNAIVNLGSGKLLIAGEAGTLLKSDDSGKTWSRVSSPYKGSFFGAIVAGDGSVVIYGMRGNVFHADAALKNWAPVITNTKASFMGATKIGDGAIALVGLSGTLMISRDNGKSFTLQKTGTTKGLSAVQTAGSNGLLLLGEAGVREALINSTSASAASASSGPSSAAPVGK